MWDVVESSFGWMKKAWETVAQTHCEIYFVKYVQWRIMNFLLQNQFLSNFHIERTTSSSISDRFVIA